LKVIRTLSRPVAVLCLQTAKVNYRNAYGKEACCLSHGLWRAPNPKRWQRIGTMNPGSAPFQAPRLGGWKAAHPNSGSWKAAFIAGGNCLLRITGWVPWAEHVYTSLIPPPFSAPSLPRRVAQTPGVVAGPGVTPRGSRLPAKCFAAAGVCQVSGSISGFPCNCRSQRRRSKRPAWPGRG